MGCTSSTAIRRLVSAALAACALAVGAAACGNDGEDASRREIERRVCIQRAANVAEAEVLARLYDEGKLGSRARIEAEAGRSFFTPDGRMLPYAKLGPNQQLAFDDWKNSNRVFELGREERLEARREAGKDC